MLDQGGQSHRLGVHQAANRKYYAEFWIAAVAAFSTVVIAILTLMYVRYSGKQWNTMRQQLELSERPWVGIQGGIKIIGSPVSAANINVEFRLKNTGNSVALDVEPALWTTDVFGASKLDHKCAAMTAPEKLALAAHVTRRGYVIFAARRKRKGDDARHSD